MAHKCEICGLEFPRPGRLTSHVNSVHLKQSNFKCSCGKSYARVDILTRHKKICKMKGMVTTPAIPSAGIVPPVIPSTGGELMASSSAIVPVPSSLLAATSTSVVASTSSVFPAVSMAMVVDDPPAIITVDAAVASNVGISSSMPLLGDEDEIPMFVGGPSPVDQQQFVEPSPIVEQVQPAPIVESIPSAPVVVASAVESKKKKRNVVFLFSSVEVGTSCANCSFCDAQFEDNASLTQHMIDAHFTI